jgi:hypothetical protein
MTGNNPYFRPDQIWSLTQGYSYTYVYGGPSATANLLPAGKKTGMATPGTVVPNPEKKYMRRCAALPWGRNWALKLRSS